MLYINVKTLLFLIKITQELFLKIKYVSMFIDTNYRNVFLK